MGGAPQQTDGTVLHVRRVAGGRFSTDVVGSLAPGDKLQVELPFGDFSLREEESRPVILLATGTGIAPVMSIVEDLMRRNVQRSLHVYRGVQTQADLYLSEQLLRWQSRYSNLQYVPVLSRPADGWTGRVGRIQDAVMADYPKLCGYVVYACGSAAMVTQARQRFMAERELQASDFYADAFLPSSA